jgi:hypothetical protein
MIQWKLSMALFETGVEVFHDGRQSATALSVQKGVCRLLRSHGFATVSELTLSSGRRVDVMAIDATGAIWVIEIKSSLVDLRADFKWTEYEDFCDRLYFAIPPEMAPEVMPLEAGLIVADRWGAEILRHGESCRLAGARRKAVTLRFARAAASRLHALCDPET